MNAKSLATLEKHSEYIAGWGNGNVETGGSLYRYGVNLYKHRDGKWYTREIGGAAMTIDTQPHWIDRDEAVKLIATKATDPITGYGYTREQAEVMADGGDAGKGYRGRD